MSSLFGDVTNNKEHTGSLAGRIAGNQSLTGGLIPKGVDGKDGVGILSIEQTTTSTEPGGINVLTFTLTNNEQYTAEFRNGSGGFDAQSIDNDTLVVSEDGKLRVNTADEVEADNTRPITSAAVHTQLGNIEVLLNTI